MAAPFGPLPPCPKSSPSNSMKKIPEEDESCSTSSANISSIPKTEVEVFEFREVEASPAKPSKEACAQTNLSDDQSPPGPAIQSKPTAPPLPTNQPAARPTNPLGCSAPKPAAADPAAKELEVDDEDEDELEFPSEKSSVCDCPAHVHDRESPLLMAQADFSSAFDQFPPETGTSIGNYSYGCLMKKWSL